MILKELNALYDRLRKQGVDLPVMGNSLQKISYRVVIKPDGTFVRIEDARECENVKNKKKMVMREMLVLGEAKPSGSGVNPCFLWDNPAYLLGCVAAKERALEYFQETKRRHLALEKEINSPTYSAVCRFFETWDPEKSEELMPSADLYTGNGIFVIQGHTVPVHEDETIQKWWINGGSEVWGCFGKDKKEVLKGMCLVSGEVSRVAILHNPPIKNVANAQSSGAKLVSFNCKSFESYGKEQSSNSPVSEQVAFGYCNALNYLLSRKNSRVRIGDATTVFWTDAPADEHAVNEMLLCGFMDPETLEAQDDKLAQRVKNTLLDISKGCLPKDMLKSDTRFFILGLSPNATRLSVRFYCEGALSEFLENMRAHYDALSLQPRPKHNDPVLISPFMILRQTSRDVDGVPPLLGGALMRAILLKQPYPDAIATAILRRFKADGYVNYIRCAYLKAWLTRKSSNYQIKPMLDEDNNQPGYVLGRLFALLQKTQSDALPSLNRTIQDAFYSSASTTPGAVFPRLLKLYRHHVAKLSTGSRINREKQVQHVMSKLMQFPARLAVEQQGMFAIGFYHQNLDLYTPQSDNS